MTLPPWLTNDLLLLLGRGLLVTGVMTAVTTVLSLALGIAVGALRLAPSRTGRALAALFVDTHRNIPALVLILIWAFALPNLFPLALRQRLFFSNFLVNSLGALTGLSLPYYALAATIALTLNTSAYLAELFRAGVGTIAQEHVDAARSLGAAPRVVFWRIILPQGVRAAFPAISTRLIHNMKNTALAAFVSVPELFGATLAAISRTFLAVELLLLAAIIYLSFSFGLSLLLRAIDHRLNRRPIRRRIAPPLP